jgi:hypothetical protein
MEAFTHVATALQMLGNAGAGSVLLALTLASAASTAILQLFKDLTPIRGWFQKWWLHRWFGRHVAAFAPPPLPPPPAPAFPSLKIDDVERQIVELATGGDRDAFYDLPSDQLVAQLNAAAQSALDYPGVKFYYPVVAVLSQGADVADLAQVAGINSARQALMSDPPNTAYADARTRLAHRIQRNLDGMQISLGDDWQLVMQTLAFLASSAMIEIAVLHYGNLGVWEFVLGLVVGALASYLSPVLNDIIKGLQSLRK